MKDQYEMNTQNIYRKDEEISDIMSHNHTKNNEEHK